MRTVQWIAVNFLYLLASGEVIKTAELSKVEATRRDTAARIEKVYGNLLRTEVRAKGDAVGVSDNRAKGACQTFRCKPTIMYELAGVHPQLPFLANGKMKKRLKSLDERSVGQTMDAGGVDTDGIVSAACKETFHVILDKTSHRADRITCTRASQGGGWLPNMFQDTATSRRLHQHDKCECKGDGVVDVMDTLRAERKADEDVCSSAERPVSPVEHYEAEMAKARELIDECNTCIGKMDKSVSAAFKCTGKVGELGALTKRFQSCLDFPDAPAEAAKGSEDGTVLSVRALKAEFMQVMVAFQATNNVQQVMGKCSLHAENLDPVVAKYKKLLEAAGSASEPKDEIMAGFGPELASAAFGDECDFEQSPAAAQMRDAIVELAVTAITAPGELATDADRVIEEASSLSSEDMNSFLEMDDGMGRSAALAIITTICIIITILACVFIGFTLAR